MPTTGFLGGLCAMAGARGGGGVMCGWNAGRQWPRMFARYISTCSAAALRMVMLGGGSGAKGPDPLPPNALCTSACRACARTRK